LLTANRERYTSPAMFDDFHAQDRWSKTGVHCLYQALVVAIATRHADAVDIKFLANGKPVWIALPHRAWEEYQTRTGKVITDSLAIQIAGHYLKSAIETGEHSGQEMYSLTVAETMQHLDAALEELLAPAKA
jgi:Fe-S cluster assembly scaffold protein SufB